MNWNDTGTLLAALSVSITTLAFVSSLLALDRSRRARREARSSVEIEMYERLTAILKADLGDGRQEPTATSTEIVARLATLEARLPDPSTLDHVSSVNEAVLAVKLEQVQKSVDSIERRLLGRGDVVLVFFGVLSALGVVVALFAWGLSRLPLAG